MGFTYINRDISWISFNERVLKEAIAEDVPLMEKFRFLSIFSSNLDEFYRVRMPLLILEQETEKNKKDKQKKLLKEIRRKIHHQQQMFGEILRENLLPSLQKENIEFLYHQEFPKEILGSLEEYFRTEITSFLEIANLESDKVFFPKSNTLYQAVFCRNENNDKKCFIVKVPSDNVSRFFEVKTDTTTYICFLDDIIKFYLPKILNGYTLEGIWNIKITRDADLDLADEYEGDLAEKIEKKLAKRDDGKATRFLYEKDIPAENLSDLLQKLNISEDNSVEGGYYHNLKDLGDLPLKDIRLNFPKHIPVKENLENKELFGAFEQQDKILHTPYQSYDSVLRFFSDAAVDLNVKEIYTTLYRVAKDSRIVNALITAAKNGKKVTVFIELKARFDEENNLKWAKKMKAAGISIIYSIPELKVHAKVALVKRKVDGKYEYNSLVATGNFNENTARFYTDHVLFTSEKSIVKELKMLFKFLILRRKPLSSDQLKFKHLLVAQFNLQSELIQLIDQEIKNKNEGKSSGIVIKVNNLEDKVFIDKLYEASNAGVKINLIVRSICCLDPGVKGQSENIAVRRIVGRFLEHSRTFIFTNGGDQKVYLGSADLMKRNIYRRIEVCVPVYDPKIKEEILKITQLHLDDNVKAVKINRKLNNKPIKNTVSKVNSQEAIHTLLVSK